jgi:flagellar biosynthesis protein FlhF
MTTSLAETPATKPALVPGRKYRFFARSAEEAVRIIHERMGPQARVLAVEQVGGQGLSRLFRNPRLEVIATIPEASSLPGPSASARPRRGPTRPASAAHEPPRDPAVDSASAAGEDPAEPSMNNGAAGIGPIYGPSGRRHEPGAPRVPEAATAFSEPDRESWKEEPVEGAPRDLRAILGRLGFSRELLREFGATADARSLSRGPWTRRLDHFIDYLWGRYQRLPNRPLTERVAFFGTPGSGITTALCKELTAAVFLRAEHPLVASLEIDRPSSSEALRAFCELMQVPLVSEERGAMTPSERVFWDIPGISSRDFDTWNEVGARLDELLIHTRVFVTHAAFDSQHLVQLLRAAEAVRPTHLVLTHLDEATQPARLWDFLERAQLCPLFAGESPSVTGGRRDDFHAALLAQTFPSHLNAKA